MPVTATPRPPFAASRRAFTLSPVRERPPVSRPGASVAGW
jgi:hypothetical protein